MTAPRVLIVLVIVAFMTVTVFHVTGYASSFEPESRHWLAASYAIAVDASIVACAMLTRYRRTAGWAWVGFAVFTAASGVMNAAAIDPRTFYAWVYSLFPTGAIGLLGFLSRELDAVVEQQRQEAEAEARREQEAREEAARLEQEAREAAARREREAREEVARRERERIERRDYQRARREAKAAQPAPTPEPKVARKEDWDRIRAGMNGDGDNLSTAVVDRLLLANGYMLPSLRTRQGWAGETKG